MKLPGWPHEVSILLARGQRPQAQSEEAYSALRKALAGVLGEPLVVVHENHSPTERFVVAPTKELFAVVMATPVAAMRAAIRARTPVDPFEVLGLARTATDREVAAAARRLAAAYHPDTLGDRGTKEIRALVHEKIEKINAAKDEINQSRTRAAKSQR